MTQADVDAGSFANTATVTGLDPADAPTSATGGTTVTADQTPGLSFTKTASPTSGVTVGDTVTYTFHGQNTGTVTVDNVDVTDPMTGLSALDCTPTTPADPRARRHRRLHGDVHGHPGRRRRRLHRQHGHHRR